MATTTRRESPIFPALVVIGLALVLALLPGRYRLTPEGVPFVASLTLAIPMLLAGFAPGDPRWARLERYAAVIVLPLAAFLQAALLAVLLRDMISGHSGISGLSLLTTSVTIWAINLLIFAIGYWMLDRGGPAGRATGWQGRADFSFPRGDASEGFPEDWQPIFADYLALAFNTSSAFSPTDVLPLTPRAKMLMMVQSGISLVTVITVAARAINILGT